MSLRLILPISVSVPITSIIGPISIIIRSSAPVLIRTSISLVISAAHSSLIISILSRGLSPVASIIRRLPFISSSSPSIEGSISVVIVSSIPSAVASIALILVITSITIHPFIASSASTISSVSTFIASLLVSVIVSISLSFIISTVLIVIIFSLTGS